MLCKSNEPGTTQASKFATQNNFDDMSEGSANGEDGANPRELKPSSENTPAANLEEAQQEPDAGDLEAVPELVENETTVEVIEVQEETSPEVE